MYAFKKWNKNPSAKKENKTIFCVLVDLFLSQKYNPTIEPAASNSQKKYQPLNIAIIIVNHL